MTHELLVDYCPEHGWLKSYDSRREMRRPCPYDDHDARLYRAVLSPYEPADTAPPARTHPRPTERTHGPRWERMKTIIHIHDGPHRGYIDISGPPQDWPFTSMWGALYFDSDSDSGHVQDIYSPTDDPGTFRYHGRWDYDPPRFTRA